MPAARRDRPGRRQTALLVAALLLLNAPLLAVVDRLALPSGAPLTPAYLFAAWLAVILLGALAARRPAAALRPPAPRA